MSSEPRLRIVEPAPATVRPPLTDVGNAERFARACGARARFANGIWHTWDTQRWCRDDIGEAERLAREVVRDLYAEAAATDDPKRRSEFATWAKLSDSRRGIENMLALAKSELGIVVRAESLDRDPMKLNTASGIVNLKTGDLGAHDPGANMTKLAPTFYRRGATSPQWLTFLDRIMGGRLDLIEFLQRAVGYSLTGLTVEQVLFILLGAGANGKTVFLEVLRSVLGDYSIQTSPETLLAKNVGGIPNDVARLRGARFAAASEVEEGRQLAESLVKQLTGGDTITARFLHREFFEFRPEFKVWLSTNHKPRVRGTEHAIWRRLRLIPFDVTIPEAERDKHLVPKLLIEAPGILAWAVEGCLAWQKQGLAEPREVIDATATYREEQDPVAQFIEERCIVADGAKGRGLYDAYRTWCEANGRHVTNSTTFMLRMQDRGFAGGRDRSGRFFQGVTLEVEDV